MEAVSEFTGVLGGVARKGLRLVDDEVRFAADLYRGSAGFYDRYRLPYPEALIAALVLRAGASGRGRLLDLACGTGQLTFPLRRWFSEVWAVDQEPDMVDLVRARATAGGAGDVRPIVSSAETLHAEPAYFELVVIGNAFHRLDRDLVAGRILDWLEPGGYLALCWSSSPWGGAEDWQRALAATLDRWKTALGAEGRVPAGWDLARQRRPDPRVLSDARFAVVGRHEFTIEHRWSLPELAGYMKTPSAERAGEDAPIRYARGEISARAFIAAERRNSPDYGATLLMIGERHKVASDEKQKASA